MMLLIWDLLLPAYGLHVLHAEGRNQMLHEAGLVVGPAGVRDERLLLQLVPLPGIFVELQIPRDLPAEDVVLADGLLDVFQLSAGRCGDIFVDRPAVRLVPDRHLAAEHARCRLLCHAVSSLSSLRSSSLTRRREKVVLAQLRARTGLFCLRHEVRLLGILDILSLSLLSYPLGNQGIQFF